jgi:hypothetical protein
MSTTCRPRTSTSCAVAIDLGGSPGSNATYAVQEALVYIDRLRDIAEGALESDACIFVD